ncbi:MAG: ribbon-helix-helix domain-containing protein [bacterium]|nr:ribbon-helix-helix domain-containing protein [bacterium]
MLKTYLYLPDTLNAKVEHVAKAQNLSKAEVIRRSIESGLSSVYEKKGDSTKSLFMLADLAKKYKTTGPKDLSSNLDKYLWEDDE